MELSNHLIYVVIKKEWKKYRTKHGYIDDVECVFDRYD